MELEHQLTSRELDFNPGSVDQGEAQPLSQELTPEQKAFADYAQRTGERFKLYGVDPSKLYMVRGMEHQYGSKKSYSYFRQYFTPSDPETNSLYHIFPFNIVNDTWFRKDESGRTHLTRVINHDEEGHRISASFDENHETIDFKAGDVEMNITYLNNGLFGYVTLMGNLWGKEGFQTTPLNPQEVGIKVPELKYHNIGYSEDRRSIEFTSVFDGTTVSIATSINRPMIIGSMITPELLRDPSNPNPELDESWLKADILKLFGVEIRPPQDN
jgi:hypothetical protein